MARISSKFKASGRNTNVRDFFLNTVVTETQERVDEAISIALKDIAQQIFDQSQEWVPVDTGQLRDSGRVSDPIKSGNTWTISITYGNEQIDYAFYVENNLPSPPEIKNYTTPNTGAFYLQRSGDMIATQENINKALKDAFRKV